MPPVDVVTREPAKTISQNSLSITASYKAFVPACENQQFCTADLPRVSRARSQTAADPAGSFHGFRNAITLQRAHRKIIVIV